MLEKSAQVIRIAFLIKKIFTKKTKIIYHKYTGVSTRIINIINNNTDNKSI